MLKYRIEHGQIIIELSEGELTIGVDRQDENQNCIAISCYPSPGQRSTIAVLPIASNKVKIAILK